MSELVRLLSPPAVFWPMITISQWQAYTDEEQDKIIEVAKILMELSEIRGAEVKDNGKEL